MFGFLAPFWEELQAAIRQGQSSNLDPSQLRPARSALEQEMLSSRSWDPKNPIEKADSL